VLRVESGCGRKLPGCGAFVMASIRGCTFAAGRENNSRATRPGAPPKGGCLVSFQAQKVTKEGYGYYLAAASCADTHDVATVMEVSGTRPRAADRRLNAAGAALSGACVLVFTTLPLLSGLLADQLRLDYRQIGQINAAYFLGAAFAAISWLWWAPKMTWRGLTHAGCALMVGALIACATVQPSTAMLIVWMLIIGIGSGTLYSLSFAVIASTREPVRGFGWKLFAEQVLSALYLYGLPAFITPRFGFTGFLLAIAGGTLVLWPIIVGTLPSSVRSTSQPSLRGAPLPPTGFWIVIAAICLFMGGLSGVWMFLERIGVTAGRPATTIGALLGLGVLVACAGALIPAIQAHRFGRVFPHAASAALLLGMFALLLQSFSGISFAVAAVILPLVMNYSLPYQYDLAGDLDASGAYAVLPSPAMVIGSFVGTLAGGSIAEAYGLRAVVVSAALCTIVVVTLLLVAVRASSRSMPRKEKGTSSLAV
jgi:predicted MFS family arabinose efflux permease